MIPHDRLANYLSVFQGIRYANGCKTAFYYKCIFIYLLMLSNVAYIRNLYV